MVSDPDELRALAEKALQRTEDDDYPWYDGTADIYTGGNDPDALYIAAANPSTVLALLAEVERLRAIEAAARTELDRHVRYEGRGGWFCDHCSEDWPCAASVELATALEGNDR